MSPDVHLCESRHGPNQSTLDLEDIKAPPRHQLKIFVAVWSIRGIVIPGRRSLDLSSLIDLGPPLQRSHLDISTTLKLADSLPVTHFPTTQASPVQTPRPTSNRRWQPPRSGCSRPRQPCSRNHLARQHQRRVPEVPPPAAASRTPASQKEIDDPSRLSHAAADSNPAARHERESYAPPARRGK